MDERYYQGVSVLDPSLKGLGCGFCNFSIPESPSRRHSHAMVVSRSRLAVRGPVTGRYVSVDPRTTLTKARMVFGMQSF